MYEIVIARNDYSQGDLMAFSRTRFTPERPTPRGRLLRGPGIMRGETVIFGSQLSGNVYQNAVFVRHDDVKSEGELIERLRAAGVRHGMPVGTSVPEPAGS